MKKIEILTTLEAYDDMSELHGNVQSLMQQSITARHNAYAPYSNFTVGCAILLENGEVVTGNNQENAAYPSGLCAERVAIYAAGAQYPGVAIEMMALTASPIDDSLTIPVPPCGACRQAIAEYENRQKKFYSYLFYGSFRYSC